METTRKEGRDVDVIENESRKVSDAKGKAVARNPGIGDHDGIRDGAPSERPLLVGGGAARRWDRLKRTISYDGVTAPSVAYAPDWEAPQGPELV